MAPSHTTMAVAAAASVPSSFTSTKALWTASETTRSLSPPIPERSHLEGINRSSMPMATNTVLRSTACSSLNFGRLRLISP
uniref:Putative secreted protein n=1 Tax=Ixodes ricinus TaxID=34613 RepID=A0A147BR67_IXORI